MRARPSPRAAATLRRLTTELSHRPELIPVVESFTGDVHSAFTRNTARIIGVIVPDRSR